MTDENLMQLVQEGNLKHAGLLFERYQKPIYNYFLKVLGTAADAEDAAQNTFSRMLRYRNSFKAGHQFSTWLYSIAVNQGHQSLKEKQKFTREVDIDTVEHNLSDVESGNRQLSSAQTKKAIDLAIKMLPVNHREILSLYLWQERDYAELARIFGAKAGTIRVRVHRALALLQEALSEYRDHESEK